MLCSGNRAKATKRNRRPGDCSHVSDPSHHPHRGGIRRRPDLRRSAAGGRAPREAADLRYSRHRPARAVGCGIDRKPDRGGQPPRHDRRHGNGDRRPGALYRGRRGADQRRARPFARFRRHPRPRLDPCQRADRAGGARRGGRGRRERRADYRRHRRRLRDPDPAQHGPRPERPLRRPAARSARRRRSAT